MNKKELQGQFIIKGTRLCECGEYRVVDWGGVSCGHPVKKYKCIRCDRIRKEIH